MTTPLAHTPGPWDFACDSYGKVQHSRKACVYTNIKGERGDRLVTIAARIPNWDDARLIVAAPKMLAALKESDRLLAEIVAGKMPHGSVLLAARQANARALETPA